MTTTLAKKQAHGSVYTLWTVGEVSCVTRQVINKKTGIPWQAIHYLARFEGDLHGMKALRAFNIAVKTGQKTRPS